MSTFVAGPLVRSVGPGSFSDLPGMAEVRVLAIEGDGITFDADLTPEQVEAIWWRMTSTDDADETKRRALAADRDALPAYDPLRRLYDYLLGDA